MLNLIKLIRTKQQAIYMTCTYLPTLIFCGALFFKHPNASNQRHSYPVVNAGTRSGQDTITLAVVGDLMCHSTQYIAAQTKDGYDFSFVYEAVKPYLSTADLCFGNLETVTAGSSENYTGYPQFNTPAAYLDGLVSAGFDVTTNVNNHSLDRRFLGIERTIDSMEVRKLFHTGTYKKSEDTGKILTVNAKGIKLAVLGYTFSTNGIPLPQGKEFCVSMIDTARMRRDVARAQQTGADKITVFIHWGNEYERQPNNYQKTIAQHLANLGVDYIFGSHPHVIQPAEIIQTATKPVFVIYSLGNFVSAQRKPYTDYGTILRVQLIKDLATGQTRTGKIDYIPTYVSQQKGYRIFPIHEAIYALKEGKQPAYSCTSTDITRMQAIWPEVTKHLTNNSIGMLPYSPQ